MLVASIPYKFTVPWGASAGGSYINAIPYTAASPAASQNLGFPPATATPVGSGGTPPNIADFNGGMNYETLWTQWWQAGGPIFYDATFQTNIAGYPLGALIRQATVAGAFWLSTVDGNTTDPDTGGAGWVDWLNNHGQTAIAATGSFVVPAGVTAIDVELWGAGGGSGGALGAGSGSGAGAGGGYARKHITGLTPGASIPVTVGAAGTAGLSTGPTNGGNGGSTIFSTYCSATGGHGGLGASGLTSTPVTAGTGTGGDLNVTGGAGTQPFALAGGNVYAASGGAAEGTPGTESGWSNGANAGVAGNFPGGGAAGAVNGANGAAGAGGLVIVRW